MTWYILLILSLCLAENNENNESMFPMALSGECMTIASQIPETSEYPKRVKEYKFNYDRSYGAARIEYKDENDVDVTFIRNYKEHYEVRLERVDDVDTCEYSYLGETMPEPEFSKEDEKEVQGEKMRCYNYQDYRQYIELFYNAETHLPSQANEYYIDKDNNPQPVFITKLLSLREGPCEESLFDVQQYISTNKCTRNGKGWPYMHIFGPFVRV